MNAAIKQNNPLSELCKEISLKRFKNHSVSEGLKIGNIREKDDGTEISQWLSLIFIKSSGLKISFKSKYHVENIKHFAANALLDSVKNLTKTKIDDFTKEFCNLTAGGIKEHLEKIVGKSNISLPLLTRWDDNVFFLPNILDDRNSFSFHDSWEIYLDSNKNRFIQCYLSVEVSDENEVKALMEEMHYTEEVAEDGEIDFL